LRPILDTDFRTPCPAPRLAEFLRIFQIRFPSPQLLSQFFLLGDVHQRADKPRNDCVFPDRHSNAADHPLHAVGPDNAFLEITSFTSRNHTLDSCLHNCAILRMYSCEIVRNRWNSGTGVEAEYFVQLARPVVASAVGFERPTARMAELLAFRKESFAAPQSFLSLFALGKIDDKRHAPLAFLVERSRAEQHRHPAAILAEILL